MLLLNREESREVDRHAIEGFGATSLQLMENAGRGAADVIESRFGASLERPVIVCGGGNNGGDGFVLARHLKLRGHEPSLVMQKGLHELSGDAGHNARLAVASGVHVGPSVFDDPLGHASLVVDALLGTGLCGEVRDASLPFIEVINRSAAPVVSLDLPSGICADTGRAFGSAVQSDLTITFAAHKRGLWQYPGRAMAGEIVLCGIGVPVRMPRCKVELLDGLPVDALPKSNPATHKGDRGRVLVVGGGEGTLGAAILASRAALRMGAGLVTLAAPEESLPALRAQLVDVMTTSLPSVRDAHAYDAVVLGCGFGRDPASLEILAEWYQRCPVPLVADADALFALAERGVPKADEVAAPRVLTPHPKEAARLLGWETSRVQSDRYVSGRALADAVGQVVILKGAGSIVTSPFANDAYGRQSVSPLGCPAMAVAGMGDVLAGATGAALGWHLPPHQAACVAMQAHGRAGELAAEGDRGLIASDVVWALPRALVDLTQSSPGPTHAARET